MDVNFGDHLSHYQVILTTELFKALEKEDLQAIIALLDKGANANAMNEEEMSPLMIASKKGNTSLVSLLIQRGAYVKQIGVKGDKKRTSLMLAAEQGHLLTIELLLQHGADVNSTNGDKKVTPLIVAAQAGKTQTVELLINKGADIHHISTSGNHALSSACYSGKIETVKFLAPKYDKTQVFNNTFGIKLLMNAIISGSFEIVDYLIEQGVPLDSPLGSPEKYSSISMALLYKKYELAAYLIKKGADVNKINQQGNTPLHSCLTKKNDMSIFKLLLESGADVHIQNASGWSPLLVAISQNNTIAFRKLLKRGADINFKTEEDITALSCAVFVGNKEIVEYVLSENSLMLEIANKKHGNTPLMLSCLTGHVEITEILIQAGANLYTVNKKNESPSFLATLKGHFPILELLLNKDPNIIHVPSDLTKGISPIFASIHHKEPTVLNYLIKKGIDVNIIHPTLGGSTALMTASQAGYLPVVDLLLNAGAEINLRNNRNQTALLSALRKKHLTVCYRILCCVSQEDRQNLASQSDALKILIKNFETNLLEQANKLFQKIMPTWKIESADYLPQDVWDYTKQLEAINQDFADWYQHRALQDLTNTMNVASLKMKKPSILFSQVLVQKKLCDEDSSEAEEQQNMPNNKQKKNGISSQ